MLMTNHKDLTAGCEVVLNAFCHMNFTFFSSQLFIVSERDFFESFNLMSYTLFTHHLLPSILFCLSNFKSAPAAAAQLAETWLCSRDSDSGDIFSMAEGLSHSLIISGKFSKHLESKGVSFQVKTENLTVVSSVLSTNLEIKLLLKSSYFGRDDF